MADGVRGAGWPKTGRFPTAINCEKATRQSIPSAPSRTSSRATPHWFSAGGRPTGGTELTLRLAQQHGRPNLVVDLDHAADPAAVRRWLEEQRIETLNVAGPRDSQSPALETWPANFLSTCFAARPADGREKRGQSPFVRSTPRAVPANGDCPLFLSARYDGEEKGTSSVVSGGGCNMPHVPSLLVGQVTSSSVTPVTRPHFRQALIGF